MYSWQWQRLQWQRQRCVLLRQCFIETLNFKWLQRQTFAQASSCSCSYSMFCLSSLTMMITLMILMDDPYCFYACLLIYVHWTMYVLYELTLNHQAIQVSSMSSHSRSVKIQLVFIPTHWVLYSPSSHFPYFRRLRNRSSGVWVVKRILGPSNQCKWWLCIFLIVKIIAPTCHLCYASYVCI